MDSRSFVNTIASITGNSAVASKLNLYNLRAHSVAWEDTSRNKNSCWGSNISDLTLKVEGIRMPLIKAENFTDVTADIPVDKLPKLVVGNESGSQTSLVSLSEYLANFETYCGVATGEKMSLYHERDSNILTSAQACVLPITVGKCEFVVDLYNYQSNHDEPAVLVVMATAYGTSAQVVCGGNTILYFNDNKTSRLFKAERMAQRRTVLGISATGPMTTEEKALNGIYIYQIPLKVRTRPIPVKESAWVPLSGPGECYFSCAEPNSLGMDRAILSLGSEQGPYKGILQTNGSPHKLVRDTERPIRLTVQFYLCTDTVNMTDGNVKEIADQIRRIYDQGLNESSLVVDGITTHPGVKSAITTRPTATTASLPIPIVKPDVTML